MNEKIRSFVAKGIIISYALLGIYGCNKLFSKPQPTQYADATPEIGKFSSFGMWSHNLDGFYMTLEESRKRGDNGRQINFFDYGFDGKLDRVRINQDGRKENIITNSVELAKWQPIFEEYRERRFGSYTNSLDYQMLQKNIH